MSAPHPALPAQNAQRTPWWWCLVLIMVAALAAYHNSFNGPFVFDDASSIVTNPTIRRLWPLSEPLAGPTTNVTAQGRPLLNLSLALNHAISGTEVRGYHALNFLIHALAGLTLFGIVRRTLLERRSVGQPTANRFARNTPWVALAISVLWTVHPLQTESVTYIIQRAESLVGLFYLLTFYCFTRGVGQVSDELKYDTASVVRADQRHELIETVGAASRHDVGMSFEESRGNPAPTVSEAPSNRSKVWLSLAVVACAAGMATKEVMVTAPLMLLFFDRTFFAGTFLGALRRRPLFYAALASTWLLLGWLLAQTGGNRGGSVGFGVGVSWMDYALTQFKAIGHYLWLTLWPHPLVFEYGSFWIREFSEIAMQVVIVFALLAATIVALWKRSALGFLGAWFFGILAPTSLAPGTTQMIVEHRMYLPLAAVLAVLVGAVHTFLARQSWKPAAWAIGASAGALMLLTVARNHDYRSDIALWTDTTAKRPDNPLAHFMLAGAQERAGDLAGAIASYERTLELKPDFSIGHEQFGELLLRQSRRADAIRHFETALRLQPEYLDAHMNVGIAYLADGRIAEAVGHLEKAAQLAPKAAMAHYNFGNALAAARLTSEAIDEYRAALKLQPTMAEAHFNLANALMEMRKPADAITHYEAAVKARSGYAAAHYNLANALAAAGRQLEAVAQYEAALRARPDYPEAHHNLGSALYELSRLAEATKHYSETLRLQPDFPNARANLERVQARMKAER